MLESRCQNRQGFKQAFFCRRNSSFLVKYFCGNLNGIQLNTLQLGLLLVRSVVFFQYWLSLSRFIWLKEKLDAIEGKVQIKFSAIWRSLSFNPKIKALFLFNSSREIIRISVFASRFDESSFGMWSVDFDYLTWLKGRGLRAGLWIIISCSHLSFIKRFTLVEHDCRAIEGSWWTGWLCNIVIGEFDFQKFLWLAVNSSLFSFS